MSAVGLIALMVVSALLEMLSVGIVMPALSLMTNAKPTATTQRFADWLGWLGSIAHERLIFVGLAGIFCIYAFKVVFLLFVAWRQVRFVATVQSDVAKRLFTIYLMQPWTFHLQMNSAELIRNLSEIPILAQMCVGFLGTIAELMVLLGLLGLLLWFEPIGAVAVGCLMGGATWLLERATRNRLTYWGQAYHRHERLCYKRMLEGLNGVKDVKIRGCERLFVEQFSTDRNAQVLMQGRQLFVNQVPRLWFELLAVMALCMLALVMAWQGKTALSMVPSLALFATAAFRMLPSVNRIVSAVQNLRFTTALIDTIASGLRSGSADIPTAPGRSVNFLDAVELQHLSFRYPSATDLALSDISLRIPRGASVGIVGGSGAGKSTLVDVILGLLPPLSGRVIVDGKDIAPDVRAWQAIIGYVPQVIYLCDESLRRNVAFGVPDERFDEAAFQRAIRAAQLDDFISSLPDGANTTIGERGVRLSGGQRQRVGIARALYHDPAVLVLDEATSALDTETEKSVMEAVDALQGDKTLIIVAHRLSTVANCDMIYKLEYGRIAEAGTFAEIFEK